MPGYGLCPTEARRDLFTLSRPHCHGRGLARTPEFVFSFTTALPHHRASMLLPLVAALLPFVQAFGPGAAALQGLRRGHLPRPRAAAPAGGLCAAVPAASAKPPSDDREWARALDTSEALVRALRARAPPGGAPLNLETDFYDASTGLHSEGVWHNALVGIACLALAASGRGPEPDVRDAPRRIALSLWAHAWDGISFRHRAHSGAWDHAPLEAPSTVVQPAYYHASGEHRCVQHGMACVFWALLRETEPAAAGEYGTIAAAFVDQFWDAAASHWTTISRAQGAATGARPSASTGTPTAPGGRDGGGDGVFEEAGGVDQVYYRAVDHAVALLALVAMVSAREGPCLPRRVARPPARLLRRRAWR